MAAKLFIFDFLLLIKIFCKDSDLKCHIAAQGKNIFCQTAKKIIMFYISNKSMGFCPKY